MSLQLIIFIVSSVPFIVSLYFTVIALFCLKKRNAASHKIPKTRFAFIIPARNEESVIPALIQSIKCQKYPRDLFDIYVIPNNCTDDTEGMAQKAGAKILHCTVPVHCKGEVLHEAFQKILALPYDAFCVLDADNLVDERFLLAMNDAIQSGKTILQGQREAKNPYDSWVSGCYALYFRLINLFSNQARGNLGLSAGINGTGFVICRSILEKQNGWNTSTMAEDLEMTIKCVLGGQSVAFVPEAIVYDEQPINFSLSVQQRRRWCTGIIQVTKKYFFSLVFAESSTKKMKCFDVLLSLLFPLLQLIGIISCLWSCYYVFFIVQYPIHLTMIFISSFLSVGAFICAMIFLCKQNPKYDRRIIKSIAAFPLFLFSWQIIQCFSIFCPVCRWLPIKHQCNIKMEDVSQTLLPRQEDI